MKWLITSMTGTGFATGSPVVFTVKYPNEALLAIASTIMIIGRQPIGHHLAVDRGPWMTPLVLLISSKQLQLALLLRLWLGAWVILHQE